MAHLDTRAAARARTAALAIAVALGAAGCRLDYTGGARPIAPRALDAGWLRAAPTPIVRQAREADCGLAALAMVAGAWGHHWPVAALARDVRPTDSGVKLGALRDLARARGLDAYAIAGTRADLRRELARGRPVVLGLILPFERDRARSHYEVAIALDPRDGAVVTLDPATGQHLRRPAKILDAEWRAAGYAALVVVGPRRHREVAARAAAGRASVARRWRSRSSTTRR